MSLQAFRRVQETEIMAFEACSQATVGAFEQRRTIHSDPELARQQGMGGLVASGMMLVAWVQGVLTEEWGEQWLQGGKFGLRFKAPVRPGDGITMHAEPEPSCGWNLLIVNERGEEVAGGTCHPGPV